MTPEDAPLDLPSHCLLSKRATKVHHAPFFHFWIDDFLPAALYQRLYQTFPRPEEFLLKSEYGNKSIMSSWRESDRFEAFCRRTPPWGELVELFRSRAFVQDAEEFLRAPIVAARGWKGRRQWSFDSRSSIRWPWEVPVRTDFEFSVLRNGTHISPHSDARKKLASLLLYLPDPRWQDSYGGGTRFFKPVADGAGRQWCSWKVNHIPHAERDAFYREMTPSVDVSFRPNRLVVFIKSECSFHDMKTIECPEDILRTSFNINVSAVG